MLFVTIFFGKHPEKHADYKAHPLDAWQVMETVVKTKLRK